MKDNKGFRSAVMGIVIVSLMGVIAAMSAMPALGHVTVNNRVFLPVVVKACDVNEDEPNDQFTRADGPLRPGVAFFGCFPNEQDEHDLFYLDLPSPSPLTITLSDIPPGHNYDLALYRKVREDEYELVEFSIEQGSLDESIVRADLVDPGRYVVQVYNKSVTASGSAYRLLADFSSALQCSDRSITQDIFAQLADEDDQQPFFKSDPSFHCTVVHNRVHDGLLALKLENKANGEAGYWGIATNGYDASRFGNICVWIYAESVPQTFTLNLRDLNEVEAASPLIAVNIANMWDRYCVPLRHYQDVDLAHLENVNLQASPNSTLWADEFRFDIACDHPSIVETQLADFMNEQDFFLFIADTSNFRCQVVFDESHMTIEALRMQYTSGADAGFWGIGLRKPFDVSSRDKICYEVYAEDVPQSFRLNLKDMAEVEVPSPVQNVTTAHSWTSKCIDLDLYAGLEVSALESLNINFAQATGDVDLLFRNLHFETN